MRIVGIVGIVERALNLVEDSKEAIGRGDNRIRKNSRPVLFVLSLPTQLCIDSQEKVWCLSSSSTEW